ncbi:DnaD domain-containing protein [Haloplasma contractile]|uniref:DnaD domain protein n=1 Tax=Haloplasma contractile SSD-17B TaxID=1033810 RepID=F7PVP0_9MOLU|nr:DnaD domain-containing protein [Haloplasma contractile]ERJ12789.1 DnaD domain protein [Haloplasma contractile SSD-17B]
MTQNPLIKKIIDLNVLDVKGFIIEHYKKLGLNETSAMLLLHIYNFSKSGVKFLSIKALTEKVTLDLNTCSNYVHDLVQSGYLSIEVNMDENGKVKEHFTLQPLYDKIASVITKESVIQNTKQQTGTISELASTFENEFGRPLSSMEIEIISDWIKVDDYDLSLIRQALKESVGLGKLSLKYIDRILLNWQKNNVNTIEKAKDFTKKFRRYEDAKKKTTNNQNEKEEVYVSWMD